MKSILYTAIFAFGVMVSSCTDDFLDTKPKGTYHSGNYDMSSGQEMMVLSKLFDGYNSFREQTWPIVSMHCHTTDNCHPGGPAGDGGTDFCQFPTLSYTPSNNQFTGYYSSHYNVITKSNEALAMLNDMEKMNRKPEEFKRLKAEAYFLRAASYFRLCQAFGAVPYVDYVMNKDDETADQLPVAQIHAKYLPELIWAAGKLPSRRELVSTGNGGRATRNAALAIIAKTYMYDKDWSNCLAYTGQIISSGDNDLSTPYGEIWHEANEFGPESVWEINCDFKPDQKIDMWCQWGMMCGIRGFPNLGFGHNAPSVDLMEDYEDNDPRYAATVIENGQSLDDEIVNASDYKFFNGKTYCPKSERKAYGRDDWCYGYWMNLRLIRYADILLMHAEAACELNKLDEARGKLEMVRARARGGNSPLTCLPEVRTDDRNELREIIHHERRIELALEFERFFDLVRWNEAEDKLANFVVGRHELFPLPQSEIDKANGKLKQNPGYNKQ